MMCITIHLVLVRVLFDECVNERGGSSDDAHVLVVQQVDNTRSPLSWS